MSNEEVAVPVAESERLLIAERAVEVGARLLRQGRTHVGALIGKGDRDFATSVDVRIEEAVKERLSTEAPGIPFLGEEEGGATGEAGELWVLDPIDGTINFARGSPLCAISLALVEDGQPILAVVDVPLLDEHFVAVRGAGAYLNGRPIRVSSVEVLSEATVAMSDFAVGKVAARENHPHMALTKLLASQALRVRMHGSEAVDLAWLACGRLDATVMLASQPWDVSGGVLLVREAGGTASDKSGAAHHLGSESTVASNHGVAEPLIDLVRTATADGYDAG